MPLEDIIQPKPKGIKIGGGSIGNWAIVATAFAVVILLIGGGLAIKLWGILSSFDPTVLTVILIGFSVLFFYLMFFRKRRRY